jgi:hypothetical protein
MEEYPGPVDVFIGIAVFLMGWAYAVAAYGFFLGLGLGWLPAAFLGVIALFLGRFILGIGLFGGIGLVLWTLITKH